MKKKLSYCSILLIALFVCSKVFAQDTLKSADSSGSTSPAQSFAEQPWIWVVGTVIVLIVIIFSLRRRIDIPSEENQPDKEL